MSGPLGESTIQTSRLSLVLTTNVKDIRFKRGTILTQSYAVRLCLKNTQNDHSRVLTTNRVTSKGTRIPSHSHLKY